MLGKRINFCRVEIRVIWYAACPAGVFVAVLIRFGLTVFVDLNFFGNFFLQILALFRISLVAFGLAQLLKLFVEWVLTAVGCFWEKFAPIIVVYTRWIKWVKGNNIFI